jgi:hypothetical protein
MIEDIIEKFSQQLVDKFDEKLKEACIIWSVNLDDHEEVARRCKIVHQEDEERKEFYIDDYLVMIYTDFKFDTHNIDEPFKMSASFECSDIMKPSDINNTKYT